MKELFKLENEKLNIKIDEEYLYVSLLQKKVNLKIQREYMRKGFKYLERLIMNQD